MLMLKREVDCQIDVMVGQAPERPEIECPFIYVEWINTSMLEAFEITYQHWGYQQKDRKWIIIEI